MTTRTAPETPGGPPAGLDAGGGLRLVRCDSEESAMPQEHALEAALARDLEESFERMVREYQDRLYSFAHRLTGNSEDAEEIAQDAFVRAYRAMKTYPAERIRMLSLKAWLYRITLNVARNRMRGRRHAAISIDERSGDGRATWEPEDPPENRPDSRFEQGRRRADIATLVAGLPERYRSALILRYMEGLRLEEVAAVLKQPLGTVKSNVHRAVNALREALSASRRFSPVKEVIS
jgi:RNA polymerase sigma-70 factor (ECF subfamily)